MPAYAYAAKFPRSLAADGQGLRTASRSTAAATGQWVHIDSTTKSATGTTAPEAPPIPPLTQAEKAREEQETRRQNRRDGNGSGFNPPHLSTR